jgi:hypothetical protein
LGHGATRNSIAGKCSRLGLLRGPRQPRKQQPADRGYLWRGRDMARAAKLRKPKAPKLPKAAKVIHLPLPPLPPPDCIPVAFIDLEPTGCPWPISGEPGPAMLCCGAPVAERSATDKSVGRSYCCYHARLAVWHRPSRAAHVSSYFPRRRAA